jgi:dienelactone hydrolase
MKTAVLTFLTLSLAPRVDAGPDAQGQMSRFFHWKPAANATRWVVFLPGSSGLRIFNDDQHYSGLAARLNRQGWSVLLVDYKPAYQESAAKPKGTADEKILWVTEQAIGWLRQAHPETSSLPGSLVGWSLGAEGVVRLVNDGTKTTALGIRSAVVYYPSIKGKEQLHNKVPLLVLSGEADDVTRAKDVKAFVQGRAPATAPVELEIYPGARHGFDVASLAKRKTIRLLPLIGPKATLQYHPGAASDAEARLVRFLANPAPHWK